MVKHYHFSVNVILIMFRVFVIYFEVTCNTPADINTLKKSSRYLWALFNIITQIFIHIYLNRALIYFILQINCTYKYIIVLFKCVIIFLKSTWQMLNGFPQEPVSPRTNRPPKMTSTLTFHRISNYLFRNKGVL